MMNIKINDVAISGDVNTTPVLTLLNGIAQGSDENNRIGNRILMLNAHVRLHVTNEVAVNDRLSVMRVLLVLDWNPNGAAPTTTDVLVAVTPQAQTNFDNEQRFTILYDRIVPLNTFGGSATAVDTYHWTHCFDVDIGEYCRYGGTTAVVGSIVTPTVYLIYFGPDAASAADFDVAGTSRLTYCDY